VNSGTITVEQGFLALSCGYVPGPGGGSVSGPVAVTNSGSAPLPPEPTPPVITSYTQTSTGTLTEQILDKAHYGQVVVNGDVNLAGGLQVQLLPGLSLHSGDQYTVIVNNGVNLINGTFAGLPEGATLFDTTGVYPFRVSYAGGDGNDLTL